MSDFMRQWGDKIVLLGMIFFFSVFAMHGWHHHDADEASFAADLVKQLVSAILTLLVAARMPWTKSGGTNGSQPANPAGNSSSVAGTSSVTK